GHGRVVVWWVCLYANTSPVIRLGTRDSSGFHAICPPGGEMTKSILFIALLLSTMSIGSFAQAPAEQLRIGDGSATGSKKEEPKLKEKLVDEVAPTTIGASTYAFSSSAAVPLDDMSSGTTLLVGANL